MSQSPGMYENRTRFTNYSSITSVDAFISDFHVSYTPGVPSPKQSRKSTRFSRNAAAASKQANISESYILPANIPNTSQVMPEQGALPNIQVHYNVPADEKQIVASLRLLQRDLAEAMQTIQDLTRERDEAVRELRSLKTNSRKPSTQQRSQARSIEQDLFDLSSPLPEPPQQLIYSKPQSKKEHEVKAVNLSDDARVLPQTHMERLQNKLEAGQVLHKHAKSTVQKQARPVVDDTERSVLHHEENATAASNTSRRRRRNSADDNMTSAYILPDITVEQPPSPVAVSKAAQTVLHSLDPEHINNCEVCYRLTKHIKASEARKASVHARKTTTESKATDFLSTKAKDFATTKSSLRPDYTAAVAGFLDESLVGDSTMRPKMHPSQALLRVKVLMDAQFRKAKERHRLAWEKYDRIEAPLSSKKHADISKEMQHWAEKMEECRVHLDYLRDVEEGMKIDEY